MKSINLAKPLAIMMVGLPGAGKSFFARQFSDTFGAPVVSFDRIMHELFSEPQFTKEERLLVANLAHYQIEELAKTKKTFLIDGGVNARIDRATLAHTVKKAGYDILLIWVQTDIATCQQRAARRNPQKVEDHYNHSLPNEEFQKATKDITQPTGRENYIVISGKHTYATQARVVLRKLAVPRTGSSEPAPLRQITVQQPGAHRDAAQEPPYPTAPPRRSVPIH